MGPLSREPRAIGRDATGALIAVGPLAPAEGKRLGPLFAAIDPWARYPYPADALSYFLAAEESGVLRLAVLRDGTVAGAVVLRPNWLRGPYLQFFALLPGAQGSGLGTAVLTSIIATARDGGERNVWVAASDFNEGALRFYERHGFVRAAALDGLVTEGRTEILLRKRLV